MTLDRRPSPLDERYGRRPSSPVRRRALLAAGAAAAALGVGVVVWLGLANADPQARSRLLGFDVVDATTVTARFSVELEEGVTATCALRARAADHAVVGRRSVVVPAGAARRVVLEERIGTEREATNAELVGCTTPDQLRPR